ncbi:MAG: PAS domain S-box protein, partial [Nitrospinales bacterium]
MKPFLNRPHVLMMLGAILAAAIFFADLMEPLGIAADVPYIIVVFLGLWIQNKYYIMASAIAASALTAAGFFLSPPGGNMGHVVANRVIAFFAIWVTAVLCMKYRKKAESVLSQTQEEFRSVIDHAMDGILTIDEAAIIQTVNASAERMFGFRAEEIVGKNLNLLMPEPYKSEHDGYVQRYLDTGEARIMGAAREVLGRRKDGFVFPLELSVSEFFRGKRRMFVGIVRDISERKQVEVATRMMSKVFMDSADPIIIEDLNGNIMDLNREAERAY